MKGTCFQVPGDIFCGLLLNLQLSTACPPHPQQDSHPFNLWNTRQTFETRGRKDRSNCLGNIGQRRLGGCSLLVAALFGTRYLLDWEVHSFRCNFRQIWFTYYNYTSYWKVIHLKYLTFVRNSVCWVLNCQPRLFCFILHECHSRAVTVCALQLRV